MSSTLHVRFNPVVRGELQSMSERSGLPESQVLTLLVRLAFRGAVPGLEALQPDRAPQPTPPQGYRAFTLNAPDVDDYEDPDDPTMPPF
jgi:hypothetical protein